MQLRASEYSLKVNGKEIQAWYWGSGPAVLLMHGWNGRGMQLCAFIDPLIKAGYKVIAFDAPGHGQTRGNKTNIIEVRDVLLALSEREGGFHVAIGHSFGVACLSAAIHAGMPVDSLVAISTPGNLTRLTHNYCQAMHMPPGVEKRLLRRLSSRFDPDTWQHFAHNYPLNNTVKSSLVVHDKDDEIVSWHEAEQLSNEWPHAQLLLTEGLGHRRILRNTKLVRQIVKIITETSLGDALLRDEINKHHLSDIES